MICYGRGRISKEVTSIGMQKWYVLEPIGSVNQPLREDANAEQY